MKKKWLKISLAVIGIVIILLVTLAAVGIWVIKKHPDWIVVDQPLTIEAAGFDRLADKCDKIVIRDGGFDCCYRTDNDLVLAEITDSVTIREFFDNIKFAGTQIKDRQCECCGRPGIDFYHNAKLLAVTSVQHGKYLRWSGFSLQRLRWINLQVGFNDVPFTPESAEFLQKLMSRYQTKPIPDAPPTVAPTVQRPERQ